MRCAAMQNDMERQSDKSVSTISPLPEFVPTGAICHIRDSLAVSPFVRMQHVCERLLLVAVHVLHVNGVLQGLALRYRRLGEVLTAAKLLQYARTLVFTFEFLQGAFDVFALLKPDAPSSTIWLSSSSSIVFDSNQSVYRAPSPSGKGVAVSFSRVPHVPKRR